MQTISRTLSLLETRTRFSWRMLQVVACSGVAVLASCKPKADAQKTESAVVANDPSPAAPEPGPKLPTVNEFGYGPLKAGMTYKAANDSLKGALKAEKDANLAECDFVKWEGGPAGLGVMIIEGKIARVDINDSLTATTDLGARVGDSEERIKRLYGPRVKVSDHKYEDGHYLTVRSADPADTLHFIIFETSKGKVTRFRAGAMPGVEYVEGCS